MGCDLPGSMLAGKSSNFDDMAAAATVIQSICRETALHTSLAERWGISSEELNDIVESPATMAYGQYLLNVGIKGERF
jgi:hydroxymethylpyrimidine/phosphomethylpyrimidine kinase